MRFSKQFVFGLIFLIIIGLVGWGIYSVFIKLAPSCANNVQDQGETGVDCGGPCISCALKTLKPIQVDQGWPKAFRATDTASGVVAEIYNPNPEWAAKSFNYQLNLKDQFGNVLKMISGTSFAYGGELKYIIEPRVEISIGKITSSEILIANPQWVSISDYPKPDVEVQGTKTDKTDALFVKGKIVNRSEIDFPTAMAYALVYNKNGNLIAASKTIVDNVPKFGSKDFKISFARDLDIYQPLEAPMTFTRTLNVGDSGDDVGLLQSFLFEGGYLNRDPTKYYDEITKQALAKMQAEVGLPPTGVFDDFTMQALNSVLTSVSTTAEITKLQLEKSVDPAKTKVFVETKR
jgi:hypothetical protein